MPSAQYVFFKVVINLHLLYLGPYICASRLKTFRASFILAVQSCNSQHNIKWYIGTAHSDKSGKSIGRSLHDNWLYLITFDSFHNN